MALQPTNPPSPPPRSIDLPVLLAVWCSFFIYSAVAAPVPAVNEPHYLCKAKHFWQPDWCANDFFLQSSNAHTVFYATVGSLTQWLSLEQSAWIGRGLAILVLAVGWVILMSALSTDRLFPQHVCCAFLVLASIGNFSGEWLVGGVEGKVFSYGFLFWAFGLLQKSSGCHWRQLWAASALTGLATSFHPVIGLWGVLAIVGSQLAEVAVTKWRREPPAPAATDWKQLLAAFVVFVLCASPGLIPALSLLAERVPENSKAAATFIQVYFRLAHHLDPMRFPTQAYVCYGLLIVALLVVIRIKPPTQAQSRFYMITGLAVLFAIAGIVIGWGPRPASSMAWYAQRAQLLKFYPFRLADVLVPMAVSVAAVDLLGKFLVKMPIRTIAYGVLFGLALCQAHVQFEASRHYAEQRDDWLDACRWIDQHLPADALVHTPHKEWSFKWDAHRAEYVAFKDCPQDAAGIVEWNNRLNFMKDWFDSHYADKLYHADDLRELRVKTKITHIFTDHLGPMELEPVYRNAQFQVYDLTVLDK